MATDIYSKQSLNASIKSYCADIDTTLDVFNKSLVSIQSYGDVDGIPMQAAADKIKSKITELNTLATNFAKTLQTFISDIYEVDVDDMPIYTLPYIGESVGSEYHYSLKQPSTTAKAVFLERVKQLESTGSIGTTL